MFTTRPLHWLQWQEVAQSNSITSSLTDLSDEQLAFGLQRGNADCLAPLVERHHSPLLGFLYRMCNGDRALAEDLVQEAFLRLIRGIKQYRHPRPFKPWLYAIAVNLARDYYKSADSRHTDSMVESFDAQASASLDEPIFLAEDAQRVAAALAALPAHQRETVILRYYQELSLNDIAEILKIPGGTVKSRLSLGLNRLRHLLEQDL
jgi:RNA polymerase sigma-70 factor, ECF subfamily